ncbi:hypothetical protein EDD93_6619 [Streptomyces sp. 840.1]|uniref:DUF6397 family protein n=1 Tax=Streptomyces sp. 840.1 TaxID=2485152 RepID=UPI000FB4B607|nr:hypothetical protein EDD93_6619 [Streptomyces sp. 840.1]
MPVTDAVGTNGAHMMAASRAAAELVLKRGEFELAVHLGIVRVQAQRGGGRPRVRQEEIDRLRSEDGFPGTLRERVRTVGTAEGARLLGISPVRFTRLARAGCVTPVAFYLNRYRAVVWLYLAQEVGALAARSPELLVGRSPAWMRDRLDAGTDCRPRNWRSRRIERLLTLTEDPWSRAAVAALALDPAQLAEVVDDPYERAYLARVLPEPVFGQRGASVTREARGRLMLADEPDEILWRRVNLIMELDGARELRQAPRPGDERGTQAAAFDRFPVAAGLFERAEPLGPAEPAGLPGLPGLPGLSGPLEAANPSEAAETPAPADPSDSLELAEPAARFEPGEPGGPAGVPVRPAEPGGDGFGPAEPASRGKTVGLLARIRLRRTRGGRSRQVRAARPVDRPAAHRPYGGRRRRPLARPTGGLQVDPQGDSLREGASARHYWLANGDRSWQSSPNVDQGSNQRGLARHLAVLSRNRLRR